MNYGPETFVVRVADDAMAPLLQRGQWVFVDPDEPMAAGFMVAFDDVGGRSGMAGRRRDDGQRDAHP